ncbi:hypothetical protein CXG81DRAFT_17205 [Caulochytrium protostelioides]|uniref:Ion transport domain-containing protein n=1 Tax=Caulochytrium protostelioides TaxID=1555241 RepID=A0A4P9XCR3_9FUNG|nr:hypothetical protein CXG81DRAFT_17205 [Caulochytrium protostelioides]|eukprot:RKP03254.1 hypothetical protein CXG81DRAFT_17205 [Caulochytrium protostelioides]
MLPSEPDRESPKDRDAPSMSVPASLSPPTRVVRRPPLADGSRGDGQLENVSPRSGNEWLPGTLDSSPPFTALHRHASEPDAGGSGGTGMTGDSGGRRPQPPAAGGLHQMWSPPGAPPAPTDLPRHPSLPRQTGEALGDDRVAQQAAVRKRVSAAELPAIREALGRSGQHRCSCNRAPRAWSSSHFPAPEPPSEFSDDLASLSLHSDDADGLSDSESRRDQPESDLDSDRHSDDASSSSSSSSSSSCVSDASDATCDLEQHAMAKRRKARRKKTRRRSSSHIPLETDSDADQIAIGLLDAQEAHARMEARIKRQRRRHRQQHKAAVKAAAAHSAAHSAAKPSKREESLLPTSYSLVRPQTCHRALANEAPRKVKQLWHTMFNSFRYRSYSMPSARQADTAVRGSRSGIADATSRREAMVFYDPHAATKAAFVDGQGDARGHHDASAVMASERKTSNAPTLTQHPKATVHLATPSRPASASAPASSLHRFPARIRSSDVARRSWARAPASHAVKPTAQTPLHAEAAVSKKTRLAKLRQGVFQILNYPKAYPGGVLLNSIFFWALILSMLPLCLATMSQFHEHDTAIAVLFWLDFLCMSIVTVEFGLVVFSAPTWRYLVSRKRAIDSLTVLFFWFELGFCLGFYRGETRSFYATFESSHPVAALKVARLTRLMRLITLFDRHSKLAMLSQALRNSYDGIMLMVLLLPILVLFFAFLFYYAEQTILTYQNGEWYYPDGKVSPFGELGTCMLFTLQLVTSIGFADTYPKTALGRSVIVIVLFFSLFIVAFPLTMITMQYSQVARAFEYRKHQRQQARARQRRERRLRRRRLHNVSSRRLLPGRALSDTDAHDHFAHRASHSSPPRPFSKWRDILSQWSARWGQLAETDPSLPPTDRFSDPSPRHPLPSTPVHAAHGGHGGHGGHRRSTLTAFSPPSAAIFDGPAVCHESTDPVGAGAGVGDHDGPPPAAVHGRDAAAAGAAARLAPRSHVGGDDGAAAAPAPTMRNGAAACVARRDVRKRVARRRRLRRCQGDPRVAAGASRRVRHGDGGQAGWAHDARLAVRVDVYVVVTDLVAV